MIYDLQTMTDKLSSYIKPAVIAVYPWLLTGIAMVIVIMIITPRSAVMDLGDESWLDSPAVGASGQPGQPVVPPAQVSKSEDSGGNPAQGSEPAQPPVDSVSALNIDPPGDSTGTDTIRSTATEQESDAPRQPGTTSGDLFPAKSLNAPAAGPDKTGASHRQDTEASSKSVDTAGTAMAAIKKPDALVAGSESRETIRDGGPWVINLASSRSKGDAERFKARAVTRGIAAGLYRVSVKGNEYWRVQVSGFATAAEAKAEAGLIKEKLGLDDVWIVKR